MEELKPCPFCGAPARFREFGPYGDPRLMVECANEFGPCVGMQTTGTGEWAHKYLAEKWNNRPGEEERERMYANLAIEQSHEIWAGAAPENKALTLRELGELAEADETVYEANGRAWDLYSAPPEIRAKSERCNIVVDADKIANGFFLYVHRPEPAP